MNEFKEITLVCDDSFDGIMTAVYDGWVLMLKGNKVKIYPGMIMHMSCFVRTLIVRLT